MRRTHQHLHPSVTSYGRDNISVFAKLHNFLISGRLLMYLLSSLSTGCWDIKCITLYFYCRVPFLLPLRIALRENRSRNPYFVKKKVLIFLLKIPEGSASRIPRCDELLVCRAYTPPHSVEEENHRSSQEVQILAPLGIALRENRSRKVSKEKAAQKVYSLLFFHLYKKETIGRK